MKVILVNVCFLFPLIHVVLSCPVVFDMSGLRVGNRSGTRIDIRPYCVFGWAQHLYGLPEVSLLKILRSFTPPKQLLIATMHCISNLSKIFLIPGNSK